MFFVEQNVEFNKRVYQDLFIFCAQAEMSAECLLEEKFRFFFFFLSFCSYSCVGFPLHSFCAEVCDNGIINMLSRHGKSNFAHSVKSLSIFKSCLGL